MGLSSHLTRVLVLTDINRSLESLCQKCQIYQSLCSGGHLLGSFNGPGPGGPESMIRKRNRERERKKDTGTEALVEQRCFNDLSVSIYRLLHKKFLLIMIMIRKPNTATVTKGTRD